MSIYQGNISLTGGAGSASEQVFIATYGVTTGLELGDAIVSGKVVFCKMEGDSIYDHIYPLVYNGGVFKTFSGITDQNTIVVITFMSPTNQWSYESYDLVNTSGGTMTGALTLHGDPTEALHAATKQYVDNAMGSVISQAFHAGTTAPSNTKLLWIDTGNDSIMKYYNGSAWAIVGSTWG